MDIDSHIPYRGRVDIRIKQNQRLEVRIPEWIRPDELRVEINGRPSRMDFSNRYAVLGNVRKRDEIVLRFPISERTEKRTIEGFDYAFVVRGNDVVSVDPPGKYLPLYQRGHYRGSETLWREVTRFVAEDELDY